MVSSLNVSKLNSKFRVKKVTLRAFIDGFHNALTKNRVTKTHNIGENFNDKGFSNSLTVSFMLKFPKETVLFNYLIGKHSLKLS